MEQKYNRALGTGLKISIFVIKTIPGLSSHFTGKLIPWRGDSASTFVSLGEIFTASVIDGSGVKYLSREVVMSTFNILLALHVKLNHPQFETKDKCSEYWK